MTGVKRVCQKCGVELKEGEVTCPVCHQENSLLDIVPCPNCSAWIPIASTYCPVCGNNVGNLKKSQASIPKPKNRDPFLSYGKNSSTNDAQRVDEKVFPFPIRKKEKGTSSQDKYEDSGKSLPFKRSSFEETSGDSQSDRKKSEDNQNQNQIPGSQTSAAGDDGLSSSFTNLFNSLQPIIENLGDGQSSLMGDSGGDQSSLMGNSGGGQSSLMGNSGDGQSSLMGNPSYGQSSLPGAANDSKIFQDDLQTVRDQELWLSYLKKNETELESILAERKNNSGNGGSGGGKSPRWPFRKKK